MLLIYTYAIPITIVWIKSLQGWLQLTLKELQLSHFLTQVSLSGTWASELISTPVIKNLKMVHKMTSWYSDIAYSS